MHKEIIKKKSCRYEILVSDQTKSIRGIYMTKNNCTTEKRTFKQLTDIQRGMLEQMAKGVSLVPYPLGAEPPTIHQKNGKG